jgi:thiosulfate/3-mercaptopyruvate sulfurtransferase
VDGNFGPWKDAGHPVSTQVVFVTPVAFEVRFRDDLNAPRDLVLGAITSGTDQVLDARSIEEHDGRKALSKRAGHVPTACHLEWVNMVDAQGRFRPIEELQAMVKAAGIVDGRPVISHCQGGGRASVNAFVLMRLGFSTRNYYPGWSDWGNAEDTPVEDGRKPTRP